MLFLAKMVKKYINTDLENVNVVKNLVDDVIKSCNFGKDVDIEYDFDTTGVAKNFDFTNNKKVAKKMSELGLTAADIVGGQYAIRDENGQVKKSMSVSTKNIINIFKVMEMCQMSKIVSIIMLIKHEYFHYLQFEYMYNNGGWEAINKCMWRNMFLPYFTKDYEWGAFLYQYLGWTGFIKQDIEKRFSKYIDK